MRWRIVGRGVILRDGVGEGLKRRLGSLRRGKGKTADV